VCVRALLWHLDTSILKHDLSAILQGRHYKDLFCENIIGRKTMIKLSDVAIGMFAYTVNGIHSLSLLFIALYGSY
jgi:hypothetical protein